MPGGYYDTTLCRLILLYLVNRMPYGVRHGDILRLNMDGEWMSYFDLEQQLLDLCGIGLLKATGLGEERVYNITADGLEIVDLYRRRIPLSVRTDIDTCVQLNSTAIARNMEVSAQYTQNSKVDYTVTLRLRDHFQPLLDMAIHAPDEASAQAICASFRKKAAVIYAHTLNTLTKEEDELENL